MTLVLTVTPNPSLDLLFEGGRLVWDDANRLDEPRRRPGGQGINVARAAHALGARAIAVALLGGRTGDEIARGLQHEGTTLRMVPAAAETRTFVAVRERETARSMLLNARGPVRSAADEAALLHAVAEELEQTKPAWVACCGSLPPGFDPSFYQRVARLAREHGARTVVDCDGEALRRAAADCDLLVPNHHEAARLLGHSHDAAVAVRELLRLGAGTAAITLGADGAVAASGNHAWRAVAPPRDTGSAVGAGDAFLAGLLVALGHGASHEEALAHAVAAASAVLLATGSDLLLQTDAHAMRHHVVVSCLS